MDLRAALIRVGERHGGDVTAGGVVEAATPADSPLHPLLTWDDTVAGHNFRLIEAAALIRSVKLTVARDDGSDFRVRAYHSVRPEDRPTPVYRPIEQITVDPVMTEVMLRAMRRDMARLKAKYEHLTEYAEAVAALAAAVQAA